MRQLRDKRDDVLTNGVWCLEEGELNLFAIVDDVVLVLNSTFFEVVVVK